VRAPRKPTTTKALNWGGRERYSKPYWIKNPIIKLPRTLTVKVPKGKEIPTFL